MDEQVQTWQLEKKMAEIKDEISLKYVGTYRIVHDGALRVSAM